MRDSVFIAVVAVCTAFARSTAASVISLLESNGEERSLQELKDNISLELGIKAEDIPSDLLSKLPSADDVNDLYGPDPVVLGLDRCEEYRQAYAPEDRFIATAGLYNTGTNFLFLTLRDNCILPGREENLKKRRRRGEIGRGILSGVHWGKHGPPSLQNSTNHILPKYEGVLDFSKHDFMPVVIVKDPVFWMRSMCHRPYDIVSLRKDTNRHGRCPFLFSEESGKSIPVSGLLSPWQEKFEYNSLVDMWNQFYEAYENYESPRLMVRYEDLLFHGERVVKEICSCAGGDLKTFSPWEGSTKSDPTNLSNGLIGSAVLYGSQRERDSIFKAEYDRDFTAEHLNADIMERLGYQIPQGRNSPQNEYELKIPQTILFVSEQESLTDPYMRSMVETIEMYREAWKNPDAEVRFLSNDDCVRLIGEYKPQLRETFELDQDELRKKDLCRTMTLYKYGGYYFSTELSTIEPFEPSHEASFIGAIDCFHSNCWISNSFSATAPDHPLLKQVLEVFFDSYQSTDENTSFVTVQEKVAATYQKGLSSIGNSSQIQLLEENFTKTKFSNTSRQKGLGDCNVVIRDLKDPSRVLFFSHFTGSDKCRDGVAPTKL